MMKIIIARDSILGWFIAIHISIYRCAGNSTHFQLWTVVLEPIEFYEVENSTLLVGLEATTFQLHAEWVL